MKQSNFLYNILLKLFEQSAISFWKVEAREWRKLYQEQRGGEAFNSIQQQLCETRKALAELQKTTAKESKYYALIGNHVNEVMGVTTNEGLLHAVREDNCPKVAVITQKQFEDFGDEGLKISELAGPIYLTRINQTVELIHE